MGYYTYYSLRDDQNDIEKSREVAAWMVRNIGEFTGEVVGSMEAWIDEIMKSHYPYELLFDDERKWYDHFEDMKMIAKAFPDITFVLEGNGEERDDVWCEYYRGDLYYFTHATITFEQPHWL